MFWYVFLSTYFSCNAVLVLWAPRGLYDLCGFRRQLGPPAFLGLGFPEPRAKVVDTRDLGQERPNPSVYISVYLYIYISLSPYLIAIIAIVVILVGGVGPCLILLVAILRVKGVTILWYSGIRQQA